MNRLLRRCRFRLARLATATLVLASSLYAGPRDTFNKLEARMEPAVEQYAKVLADWETKNGAGTKAPKPADPRGAILDQMDMLAESTLDTDNGAYIAVQCFVWSWMYDIDLPKLHLRFRRIAQHYPNSTDMADLLDTIPLAYSASGTPADWIGQVLRVYEVAREESVRLAALSTLGQVYMKTAKPADAKSAFEQIIKLAPKSDFATKARGLIYVLENLQVGMTAPVFATKTIDGKSVSLNDLRGKTVLVNFWATWCPTCVAEIPELKKAVEHFKGKPFVILAVSLNDTKKEVVDFVKNSGFPGIHTWDETGPDNPASVLYNAEMLPTWYLVDGKGIIRARDPFHEKLIPAIEAVLGGK